ncbi:hypothetical protein [Salinicola acroporae]|uniref:hypothetical protein n=1 Tax=Salinicola acroporae TaxID=1541440 RepID=UPI0013A64DA7|nr:hypothetical protein [Salinicola acroporae]
MKPPALEHSQRSVPAISSSLSIVRRDSVHKRIQGFALEIDERHACTRIDEGEGGRATQN